MLNNAVMQHWPGLEMPKHQPNGRVPPNPVPSPRGEGQGEGGKSSGGQTGQGQTAKKASCDCFGLPWTPPQVPDAQWPKLGWKCFGGGEPFRHSAQSNSGCSNKSLIPLFTKKIVYLVNYLVNRFLKEF